MSADLSVDNSAVPSPAEFRNISQAGLNRTIERARTLAGRRTSEEYNLSTRQLLRYVKARKVTRKSNKLEGSVDLSIQPIRLEEFRPRIVMKQFTYVIRGKTVTRRLATVRIRHRRNVPLATVQPAFPEKQRESGSFVRTDRIFRRVGAARDKLTFLRFHTFPLKFIDEKLLPSVQQFAGPRLQIEMDQAFKAYASGAFRAPGKRRRVVK